MYSRLSERLKSQQRSPLNSQIPLPFAPQDAAVLVLIHPQGDEDHIVLTKRSELVLHHKGQIAFPGGVHDATDKDLWHTALRETHEEIGIKPDLINYIGELGKIYTPSGFKVTPYVGHSTTPLVWTPNPGEIAEIFTVPITHLLDPKNLDFVKRTFNDVEYKDPVITFGEYKIWGATGRILVELLEVWKDL